MRINVLCLNLGPELKTHVRSPDLFKDVVHQETRKITSSNQNFSLLPFSDGRELVKPHVCAVVTEVRWIYYLQDCLAH